MFLGSFTIPRAAIRGLRRTTGLMSNALEIDHDISGYETLGYRSFDLAAVERALVERGYRIDA